VWKLVICSFPFVPPANHQRHSWTFGSTETVESYWALATGQLPVLSQQFILDCTANSKDCGGTGGCQGGTATLAINTIVQNGGIPQEWTYSYKSYFGATQQCMNATTANWSPFARVTSQTHLPFNVEAPVIESLATTGPLITNVDASGWFAYEAGVFNGCSVNATIDHVVQLVGYGYDAESKMDYLLVRNSWNPSWGEEGYIRLVRQTSCGWDNNPGEGNHFDSVFFVSLLICCQVTCALAARRAWQCADSAESSTPTRTSTWQ
jgi:cathepsin L